MIVVTDTTSPVQAGGDPGRNPRGRLRAWTYWPVVSHPVICRLLPGYALSALGDGMSAVAIAWLALRLAPEADQGLWVGAAVAAYSVPGVLGAVLLGRWLRHRAGIGLAGADATLRAVALGAIPVLNAAHLLTPTTYVCLLGVSSLLHAWGSAGQYTLVAEVLPAQHRLTGNALLAILADLSLTIGPALAGLLTAAVGPATVIGADAATWAVLAVSYALAAPRTTRQPAADPGNRVSASGLRMIGTNRTLLGLVALSFVFFLLYGPVEVALPVHVATDLHGSASLLGWFWAAYGVGAVIGSLTAPYLRNWPLWPTMIAIVGGWGLALLPLGLGAPTPVSLAGFAIGGVIYAPYNSIAMAVFQDRAPTGALASLLAARAGLMIVASPLGTALGGPLVTALGARGTLFASALTTIALAILAAAAQAARRSEPHKKSP
jgi:MFS transporter, DHA3 family, macrolide efflux protein